MALAYSNMFAYVIRVHDFRPVVRLMRSDLWEVRILPASCFISCFRSPNKVVVWCFSSERVRVCDEISCENLNASVAFRVSKVAATLS